MLIYGVEIEAHATSQIVNAVLNGRPLLHIWSEGICLIWLGVSWIALIDSSIPWKTLLSIVASVGLVGICYGLLILSWWVPVVPALLACAVQD